MANAGTHYSEKTVLLTGASTGIGKQLAIELAKHGATVGLVARRAELVESLAKEIVSTGGKALPLPANVIDREAIHECASKLRQQAGSIDILIANAGVGDAMRAKRFSAERIAEVIEINLVGVANCIEAVLPEMLERKSGQIAAVTSLAAWRGLPTSTAYGPSKAAVTTMLECLRHELRPKGIYVTNIVPGFVETPLTEKNRYYMPFLISAEKAASIIVPRLARKKREIAFPFPTALGMRFARLLPLWAWDLVAPKLMG